MSKSEDSITSLAVGKTIGDSTPVYAGINSNPNDVVKGKNEHFRIFNIEDKSTKGKITATKIVQQSKCQLFSKADEDAYQRVIRLSKPYGNSSQIGVVATGLAKESELVVFDTAYSITGKPHVKSKTSPTQEAEDTDVIQTGEDQYLFAYCNKKEVFLKKIGTGFEDEEVQHVWTIPGPETQHTPPVMDFRSLRFLTPEFLLLLSNLADNKGVIVQVLRLPSAKYPKARIAVPARLDNSVTKATGIAVTCLTPFNSYDSRPEAAEFLVAVAGHDKSISLLTFHYSCAQGIEAVIDFKVRARMQDVHPLQMTSIALSNIHITERQNVVKLASVSMANTVVVHSIPLKVTTSEIRTVGQTRYIIDVRKPSRSPTSQLLITLLVLFIAFVTQTILEVRDVTPELINAKQFVSPFYQGLIRNVPQATSMLDDAKDFVDISAARTSVYNTANSVASSISSIADSASTDVSNAIPTDNPVSTVTDALNPMLQSLIQAQSEGKQDHVIFIREEQGGTDPAEAASIKADLHHEDTHGPHGGKRWEEMSEGDRKVWLKKLRDAGHIGEEYAETILKGVVFGTIGQVIGQAVAR